MKELERLFKGLADSTRLRIVNLLLHGELCVCDVQYVLDAPQPNVSRHLTYLKNSGLVSDRREGQRIYYRLAGPPATARTLFEFLRDALHASDVATADLRKLRKAVRSGACTVSESKPYSALVRPQELTAKRVVR